MIITYRDKLGIISVQILDNTLSFLDGFVYFDDAKIPVENVISIVSEVDA